MNSSDYKMLRRINIDLGKGINAHEVSVALNGRINLLRKRISASSSAINAVRCGEGIRALQLLKRSLNSKGLL